jgi:phospholipid/cholesterol/gamma-HCH transport system substrate-binding protein
MTPEANKPAATPKPAYDERVYRRGKPPHRSRVALVAIALLIVGTYLAWTKELPFQNPYELKAVFSNAANIRVNSPVRIAGVNVGEVKSIRQVGEAAEVTFTVDDEGRPIHDDAEIQIRPRIFLEGNFFLDLRPGSPSASELPDEGTIPITQTATAVQLDEVLTALQAPDRANLIRLLAGFGAGLNHEPSAAEDQGQDPDVQGETGGQAINDSFQYGGAAGRDTAIVSEALQGTEPHDLSRLVDSLGDTFAALAGREADLQGLVTNLNTTTRALAVESDSVSASIRELAPTLERAKPTLLRLNDTLPALRAFARDITPGLQETPATIKAGMPWLKQVRLLATRRNELRPIARNLLKTAPNLARFSNRSLGLLSQTENLSRCVSDVLLPTGDLVIDDQFATNVPNWKEFLYGAVNMAGESQNFDANGPYLRFQSGSGPQMVNMPNPAGDSLGNVLWGRMIQAPGGSQPVLGPTPPFRTDVACHTQPVPNVSTAPGNPGAVGPPTPSAVP